MTITLPNDLSEFVKSQVESGAYPNESELMADAVRRLKEHPKPPEAAKSSDYRPIWEIAKEIADSLPPDVVALLPVAGAEQHDHYINGTPKQPKL